MKLINAFKACLASLFLLGCFASVALGDQSGIYGSEIFTPEASQFIDKLRVDEEVTLDFKSMRLTANYKIENITNDTLTLNMFFPIKGEVNARTAYEDKLKETLDFKASVNSKKLEIIYPDPNIVFRRYGYKKYKSSYKTKSFVGFSQFQVPLSPGNNRLEISYNIIFRAFLTDNDRFYYWYEYSLDPAKTWVSKFGKATYTILSDHEKFPVYDNNEAMVLPKTRSNYEKGSQLLSTHKWGIYGPGERNILGDTVVFSVENFEPIGHVAFIYDQKFIDRLILDYKNRLILDKKKTDMTQLEVFFEVKPYSGDSRCYWNHDIYSGDSRRWGKKRIEVDHRVIALYRNEIFARKGYVFKTEEMNRFFSKFSWYEPLHKDVKLNSFEEWNVKYLHKIELILQDGFKLTSEMKDQIDTVIGRGEGETCRPLN